MTDEQYELIIAHLMGERPDLAGTELDKLSRPELDEVFERATAEQVAREDVREMVIRRLVRWA